MGTAAVSSRMRWVGAVAGALLLMCLMSLYITRSALSASAAYRMRGTAQQDPFLRSFMAQRDCWIQDAEQLPQGFHYEHWPEHAQQFYKAVQVQNGASVSSLRNLAGMQCTPEPTACGIKAC